MKFWYRWEGLWWWSLLIGSLGRRITSQKGESREWRDLYSFNVIHENSPPGEWNLCNDPPCYASIAEYTLASIATDKIIEPYRPTTIRRIGGEYHGCQFRDQNPRQRNVSEKRKSIESHSWVHCAISIREIHRDTKHLIQKPLRTKSFNCFQQWYQNTLFSTIFFVLFCIS